VTPASGGLLSLPRDLRTDGRPHRLSHRELLPGPSLRRRYPKLFAAEPARIEQDYAKWMLEDPRVNFDISALGHGKGIVARLRQ